MIAMLVHALLTASQAGAVARVTDTTFSAAAVERWLDGFMMRAREPGDIAGAVVVVVKDSSIVLAKGYGWADASSRKPVDPDLTLFRPGSISKMFAWISVMQLVEQGRLDLDRDIQGYVDFPLRGGFTEPITLRRIMTHTAGYEETLKEFYTLDSTRVQPLGQYLARRQPHRIYRPGSTPAYSNYATALAGYIVERTAGVPFEKYVEDHIFTPLGMRRSSFRQPLPAHLAPMMSRGYVRGSDEPYPFEIFGPSPAGGLSSTGIDMGRFLLAMLNGGALDGQRIIGAEMLDSTFVRASQRFPTFPGMGLGWYRRDRNGRRVVGHGGDTRPFHSELRLLLDDNVGIYVSFNSLGRDGAVFDTRTVLINGFLDTFFPARSPAPSLPATSTAAEHARLAQGQYEVSRRWESSFLSILNLSQATVTALDDGTLTVSAITGLNGNPKVWREVGDWIWIDRDNQDQIGMTVESGRVTGIMQSDDPATEYLRAPWWRDVTLVLPLVGGSLLILAITILSWPIGALLRRWYRVARADRVPDVRGYYGVRIVAILVVGLIVGWGLLVGQLVSNHVEFFTPDVDWRLRVLSLLGVAATLGVLWLFFHAARAWRGGRSLAGKLVTSTIAIAAAIVMVFAWLSHFVPTSVAY
jgi:CubicO group peptidase (beta-lactamase class C family)